MSSKTTIITGASGGIGQAMAEKYFNAGHNVVLAGRDEGRLNALAEKLGDPSRIEISVGDIANLDYCSTLISDTVARFGDTLTNLINNAGTFLVKPFLDTTAADLKQFQDFFLGTYCLTQAGVAQMKKQAEASGSGSDNGSIVFISTIFADGFIPQFPCSAVASAKASFGAFTKNVAHELASLGIRVNTLELGVIETGIYGLDSDGLAGLKSMQPLNMNGQTAEVARFTHFLTEESPFTTGQIMAIDGGVKAGHFCGLPN